MKTLINGARIKIENDAHAASAAWADLQADLNDFCDRHAHLNLAEVIGLLEKMQSLARAANRMQQLRELAQMSAERKQKNSDPAAFETRLAELESKISYFWGDAPSPDQLS